LTAKALTEHHAVSDNLPMSKLLDLCVNKNLIRNMSNSIFFLVQYGPMA
jgi:hypothetical protein